MCIRDRQTLCWWYGGRGAQCPPQPFWRGWSARSRPVPCTCLLYTSHNCYPSDMPVLWDFMEHFSFVVNDDGTITRYYSASAFAEDDAVVLE